MAHRPVQGCRRQGAPRAMPRVPNPHHPPGRLNTCCTNTCCEHLSMVVVRVQAAEHAWQSRLVFAPERRSGSAGVPPAPRRAWTPRNAQTRARRGRVAPRSGSSALPDGAPPLHTGHCMALHALSVLVNCMAFSAHHLMPPHPDRRPANQTASSRYDPIGGVPRQDPSGPAIRWTYPGLPINKREPPTWRGSLVACEAAPYGVSAGRGAPPREPTARSGYRG